MARYRKRPVEIDAWRAPSFDDDDFPGQLPDWLAEAADAGDVRVLMVPPRGVEFVIGTLEGTMRADVGDWLIRGIEGEIYPCKPGIFAQTYEPIDAGPADTPGLAPEDLVRAASAAIERGEQPHYFAASGAPSESAMLCMGALTSSHAMNDGDSPSGTAMPGRTSCASRGNALPHARRSFDTGPTSRIVSRWDETRTRHGGVARSALSRLSRSRAREKDGTEGASLLVPTVPDHRTRVRRPVLTFEPCRPGVPRFLSALNGGASTRPNR